MEGLHDANSPPRDRLSLQFLRFRGLTAAAAEDALHGVSGGGAAGGRRRADVRAGQRLLRGGHLRVAFLPRPRQVRRALPPRPGAPLRRHPPLPGHPSRRARLGLRPRRPRPLPPRPHRLRPHGHRRGPPRAPPEPPPQPPPPPPRAPPRPAPLELPRTPGRARLPAPLRPRRRCRRRLRPGVRASPYRRHGRARRRRPRGGAARVPGPVARGTPGLLGRRAGGLPGDREDSTGAPGPGLRLRGIRCVRSPQEAATVKWHRLLEHVLFLRKSTKY